MVNYTKNSEVDEEQKKVFWVFKGSFVTYTRFSKLDDEEHITYYKKVGYLNF